MHGKAMPYAVESNNIIGTHENLKGSKLVNLSDMYVYLCNIVQRVVNYFDQKEIILCTNSYLLKQIDILCSF